MLKATCSLPRLALPVVSLSLSNHKINKTQDDSAAATPRSKSQMPRVSLQDRLLAALDGAELPHPQRKRGPAAGTASRKASSGNSDDRNATTQAQALALAEEAVPAPAPTPAISTGCFPSMKCVGRAVEGEAGGGGGGGGGQLSNLAVRGNVRRALLEDVKLRSEVRKALLEQPCGGGMEGGGERGGGGGGVAKTKAKINTGAE